MQKAADSGQFSIRGAAAPFTAAVTPDPFDARDLYYRPRLQLLDDRVDRRIDATVLTQDGSSCTGHAVAAMINTVYTQKAGKAIQDRVSPYMLYYLARRYDEFAGEEDAGSSLRGVLKGWWRHGVALDSEWPELETHFDFDDKGIIESCRKRPLGAYYRVDTQRLDDMQSAITELHAIVASGMIHDGWRKPAPKQGPDGKLNFIIEKTDNSVPIGGHAFALVGYNEIGFLVQNSWGTTWGKDGFATLPYEDWLDCAYDAWVARPGVPQTPFQGVERRVSNRGTLGVSVAPPPDVVRQHVLNLGNDGKLSKKGQTTSSPAQLRELIASMQAAHAQWGSSDTVIYIHGGLVAESSGLSQVREQHQWWMNNHVYPIFIVWESGPIETLLDQLSDTVGKQVPFGAGLNFQEAIDRLIEKTASSALAFAWAQMKQNAVAASGPLAAVPVNDTEWFGAPGASLLLLLLKAFPGVRLHLVGHSAGAVFVDGLLPRLKAYDMPLESLTLMAAASTVEAFGTNVLPHLGSLVKRFTSFTMNDTLELNDTCAKVYHKSLLYLVSRGFEKPKNREVPLVGMQRFFTTPLGGKTLAQTIADRHGEIVVSSNPIATGALDDVLSNAQHHGDFHNDPFTMTAVLLRIAGQHSITNKARQTYVANSPQLTTPPAGMAMNLAGRVVTPKSPVVGTSASFSGTAVSNATERRSRKRKGEKKQQQRAATPKQKRP
ncbi:MAG: hypothetical protein QOI58_1541 [Thermoanaerobaculia bacterium]|jgi:hypothetical protein|nr:hypothetical protein [Thermoanaerobaculia bacterium]